MGGAVPRLRRVEHDCGAAPGKDSFQRQPGSSGSTGGVRRACPVTELTSDEEIRFPTGMGELDRVLGGGAVKGSLVLVGRRAGHWQIHADVADLQQIV